jgi:hypothetical protein
LFDRIREDIVRFNVVSFFERLDDTDFPQDKSTVSDGETKYAGEIGSFATDKLVHVRRLGIAIVLLRVI